jgi:hypothetical protein
MKQGVVYLLFLLILIPRVESVARTKRESQDVTVYVTRTGAKYHKEGCRYLSKSMIPMKLSEAVERYSPCSVCKPPVMQGKQEAVQSRIPSVKEKAYSGRCQAITKKGTQCKRKARPGSKYCWQHGG